MEWEKNCVDRETNLICYTSMHIALSLIYIFWINNIKKKFFFHSLRKRLKIDLGRQYFHHFYCEYYQHYWAIFPLFRRGADGIIVELKNSDDLMTKCV